mgnify:CR=1 FL=1
MRPAHIYIAIFFSILCMSTSSILVRCCTAPALIISFYRVLFTAGIAGAVGQGQLTANLKKLSQRELYYTVGAGFFLALHLGFWISSLNYTSISSSVLFTNLQVIFVLILSALLLKEKVNRIVTIGILIALAGSILIVNGDLASGKIMGDLLALLSGLFVALFFLIGRKVRDGVDIWTYTFLNTGTAAVVLFIGCKIFNLSFFGFSRLDWLWFLLQALAPGLAGHAILNWALKYVKAPLVSVSVLGESVGASILAYIIFREALAWYQIIGGIFILTGIYIAATHEKGPTQKVN